MFADDIVLVSDSRYNLQKLLNHVYEWCRKWQLSINPVKTEVMHFHRKNKPRSQVQFFVGSKNIKVVPKDNIWVSYLMNLVFFKNVQH